MIKFLIEWDIKVLYGYKVKKHRQPIYKNSEAYIFWTSYFLVNNKNQKKFYTKMQLPKSNESTLHHALLSLFKVTLNTSHSKNHCMLERGLDGKTEMEKEKIKNVWFKSNNLTSDGRVWLVNGCGSYSLHFIVTIFVVRVWFENCFLSNGKDSLLDELRDFAFVIWERGS